MTARERTSWFFIICKDVKSDYYEMYIGYKYSSGEFDFFSANARTCVLKEPWNPPTSCEFKLMIDKKGSPCGEETIEGFKFLDKYNTLQNMRASRLNTLFAGDNDFTRKLSAMIIERKLNLMANYLTLMVHSKTFGHHSSEFSDDGLRTDGKGINEEIINENGGSIEELRNIILMAQEAAYIYTNKSDVIKQIATCHGVNIRKKRRIDTSQNIEVKVKLPRSQQVSNSQKYVINEEGGVEKQYLGSFTCRCDIEIEKITLCSKICPRLDDLKVKGIANMMELMFDPSKIHITVTPIDPKTFDVAKPNESFYKVISGNHCIQALKLLDQKGQLRNKTSMHGGLVNCYVVNTENPDVLSYGWLRSNYLDSKFCRSPSSQDLLFVYDSLRNTIDDPKKLEEIVIRYSKVMCIGTEEVTAIKMFLKWETDAFKLLLKVIKSYEKYQTLDNKIQGHQSRLMRGEALPLSKGLFKKLSKVDREFFLLNGMDVIDRKVSVKDLVDNFTIQKELNTLKGTLEKICGVTFCELKKKYPGKFSDKKLKLFSGYSSAKVSNDRELKLKEYCNSIIHGVNSDSDILTLFECDTSEIFAEIDFKKYDVFFFAFGEEQHNKDMRAIMEKLFCQEDSMNATVFILFKKEKFYRTFLSLSNYDNQENLFMTSLVFEHSEVIKQQKINENIKFCLLVTNNHSNIDQSLSLFNGKIDNVQNVIKKMSPTGCRIAYVDMNMDLVLPIHDLNISNNSYSYFAKLSILENFKSEMLKTVPGDKIRMITKSSDNINKVQKERDQGYEISSALSTESKEKKYVHMV